ncbi:efflux RND transporter periplasmic adaptor subunit [Zooshikella ganghwensis]|uniref:Efflux RND transporter periplasmic adaptor subunit n=1 Tax=Zooshikella ganghwensis TaxID=202772 RepID=A0A4V1IND5_9GAMM|nr:efflux RND transporter periplasmic adaptor subunit [Zooshikella ganghwensis]RDH43351.1 efflux RND transporter periplasmic adaptor subunit [Zooshikella ganghwensis]
MTTFLRHKGTLITGIILGILLGLSGYKITVLNTDTSSKQANSNTTSDEKKPLYWVAPMDPNYRRDKPGKSPMGMDLIPVYKEDQSDQDAGPGTIKIAPNVVNNLGVRTAKVTRQPLTASITTVGYIQYDQDRLIHIHPRVEGWVETLYVKAQGNTVQKGDPLYAIYSPALVNAQEEFLLALQRNNQQLINAAIDRLKALQLPTTTIEKLRKTRQVQQTVTFFAPQSGVVDNLNIREGFFVKPGMTLMALGSLKEVWVEAEVFERQAALVKPDMAVTMSLDYLPGKTWQGKVDYIYPTLDAKTRTVKVRLRFANPNKVLKPNMFAQVVIHADSTEQRLLVPREAIIRTGRQDRVVLALGDGQFKSIAITMGKMNEHYVEVINGLKEGDSIVTSAQFLLDSESSKNSDFQRMSSTDQTSQNTAQHEHHTEQSVEPKIEKKPSSAWVEAEVHKIMPDTRKINVTHQAIPEWQWPVMTMDFMLADNININQLSPGLTVHIEVQKASNNHYQITQVHIPNTPQQTSEKTSEQQHSDHSEVHKHGQPGETP